MQLAHDLSSDLLVPRPGALSGIDALTMPRGKVPLAIQFCQGSILAAPPSGATVFFGLKLVGAEKNDWLSLVQLASVDGSTGLYQANLQNNTPEMIAAAHADPADSTPEIFALPTVGQLYYLVPGDTEPSFSQIISVTVTGVLWTGVEGVAPSPNLGNPSTDNSLLSSLANGVKSWLATSALGRTLLNIANAAAGRTALGLGTAAVQPADAFVPGYRIYSVDNYGIAPNVDCTSALQALYDLIGTRGENAVIYFPTEGPYIVSGALQNPEYGTCAQLVMPRVGIGGKQYTILHKGCSKITFSPSAYTTTPLPAGTVIKSTLTTGSDTGVKPCVFCGNHMPTTDNPVGTNFVAVGFEDLIIQLPADPQVSAVNLYNNTNTFVRGTVAVIAGNSQSAPNTTAPTNTNSYAWIMPRDSSGIEQRIDGALMVIGFSNGVLVGEGAVADVIGVFACHNGVLFEFANGPSRIRRLLVGWCANEIVSLGGAHAIVIDQVEVERWTAAAWYQFNSDVYDSDNQLTGTVGYHAVVASVGYTPNLWTKVGGANLVCTDLSPVPPAIANGRVALSAPYTITGAWATVGNMSVTLLAPGTYRFIVSACFYHGSTGNVASLKLVNVSDGADLPNAISATAYNAGGGMEGQTTVLGRVTTTAPGKIIALQAIMAAGTDGVVRTIASGGQGDTVMEWERLNP